MANHVFNIEIATKYGIEEAIIIEQLYWWIRKNECDEIEDMVHEGRVWCRSTAKGFAKYIPYMKPDKIWRILRKLEGSVFMVGNFNRQALNQTLWYTFTDEFKKELKKQNYDFEKIKNANLKNKKSNNSIINNPINNEVEITDKKRVNNKLFPQKKNFIKPSIDEIQAYIDDKKLHLDAGYFFDYYESKGWMVGKNKMKDWKSACRNWERMYKERKKENEEPKPDDELTPEQAEKWQKSQEWLQKNTPRIWQKIGYKDFWAMVLAAHGKRDLFSEIIERIDQSSYDGDIVSEFDRIAHEEEFYWRIWDES